MKPRLLFAARIAAFATLFTALLFSCNKEKNPDFKSAFSGTWRIAFYGQICNTALLEIGDSPGAYGTSFAVLFQNDTKHISIECNLSEEGQLSGSFSESGFNLGPIEGVLKNGKAQGQYEMLLNGLKLSGSWTAEKVADPCQNMQCGANGTCVNGVCQCNEGYEGCSCSIPAAAKFIGTYDAVETCTKSGTFNYGLTVLSDPDPATIRLKGMGDFGGTYYIKAKLVKEHPDDIGYSKFTINTQGPQNIFFQGSGRFKNNEIVGTYYNIYPDGTVETCNFKYIKQ
jgi:hypothetical protein